MKLRKFEEKDSLQCAELFYETIHSVNAKDYTAEQLDAWAPPVTDERIALFCNFLSRNISYVVEKDEKIVGFSDLEHSGYYNCLYVHKDYQGQGMASKLYAKLEDEAKALGLSELTVDVSITAKPFFEKKGLILCKEQQKLHNGVYLKNYVMKKILY